MELFSQDMDGSCLFGGKADICKEFDCHRTGHDIEEQNAKKTAPDVFQTEPIRGLNKKDTNMDEEMAPIQTSSIIVSPNVYKILMDNLYISRLWFLRARNITMNQLNVYKEEAIEHMHEIKQIIHEELENPEASAELLAQELVKAGTEVIRNQQALNRIEMEELLKNLNSLLDTLSLDVKEVKCLADPEYKIKGKKRSCVELIFNYGHWCLFVLYVTIIFIVGLYHYLPAFEEYL